MKNYILLPQRGYTDADLRDFKKSGGARDSVFSLSSSEQSQSEIGDTLNVVETIREDGPRILQMTADEAKHLRRNVRGLRLAPQRYYRKAMMPMARVNRRALGQSQGSNWERAKIVVIDDTTGEGVPGVKIKAINNRTLGTGISRTTGASGQATLTMPSLRRLDELLFYPPHSLWGLRVQNVRVENGDTFKLKRFEPADPELLLRSQLGASKENDGKGVRIAVIDSGVDARHPELSGRVKKQLMCIVNDSNVDPELLYVDGHGTHVAGIIAGKTCGLAPAAEIYDYRVFTHYRTTSRNIDILKAIDTAVEDGCDLINVSLGGGQMDVALNEAIGFAMEAGTLCIAAAGNNTRDIVDYPASFKRSLAVSAYGHRLAIPPDAVEFFDPRAEYSPDNPDIFIAGFSNIGPEVDFTGPGVAIVSAWPTESEDGEPLYSALSGTSMATPAVTGIAARLLSRDKHRYILDMERSMKRTLAMVAMLQQASISLSFPQPYEGYGKPDSEK